MPDTMHVDTGENAYRISGRVYHPAQGLIRTAHGIVRLEPRLARLLDLFVQSPGKALSRSDILDKVWAENGSDEALTQAVSRLRRHLGHDTIRTLPRIGYVLATPPEPIALDSEPAEEPALPQVAQSPGSSRLRMGIAFFAGLATGIALAVLLAPVLMTRQIEIEESVNGLTDETRLIRTTAECSMLVRDCVPDDRLR
ncbi:winged helix-turn-helix domain-containing protein [Hyphobacterium sp.]|uniref:winged helix-turn-helix domain-containing protein n=1 Tax=Hyphobacterium sp. TaxID=2004662 RepID=UPI003B52D61A